MLLQTVRTGKCAPVRRRSCVVLQHWSHMDLFELRTLVSGDSDSDSFPLALPPMEGIVSYSQCQHGQLSMSIFYPIVFHLQTESN